MFLSTAHYAQDATELWFRRCVSAEGTEVSTLRHRWADAPEPWRLEFYQCSIPSVILLSVEDNKKGGTQDLHPGAASTLLAVELYSAVALIPVPYQTH